MSGVKVAHAVELDSKAAETFLRNHALTTLHNQDIRTVSKTDFKGLVKNMPTVIFGGPPCQGFSTSNQTNRSKKNINNWLFEEYLRIVGEVIPDWVVFENVKGLVETESGYFLDAVLKGFKKLGYATSHFILNSADFGVPQKRNRLFIVGSLHGIEIEPPKKIVKKIVTVKEAFRDLPDLENGASRNVMTYPRKVQHLYAKTLRGDLDSCSNNIVTNNAPHIIERYGHIPQGGNWEHIPKKLMKNYEDVSRCHTGIYRRLVEDEPSVVIGNFRKNMLIHPWCDRGLSVRERRGCNQSPIGSSFMEALVFSSSRLVT